MAFYRRRFQRKRAPVRRKRFFRRKYRKWNRRTKMGKGPSKYLFTRTQETQIVQSVNAAQNAYYSAFIFQLSDCPNYTEFTSLFDQYKICAVKVSFANNYQNTFSASGVTNVELYTINDFDDASAPSTASEFLQYQSFKSVSLMNSNNPGKITRYVKPMANIDVESVASHPRRVWIDCGAPGIDHYGLKYGIRFTSAAGHYADAAAIPIAYSMTINIKYYLAFKNVR